MKLLVSSISLVMWINDGEHDWACESTMGKNRYNVDQWWRTWLRCESTIGENAITLWKTPWQNLLPPNWIAVHLMRLRAFLGANGQGQSATHTLVAFGCFFHISCFPHSYPNEVRCWLHNTHLYINLKIIRIDKGNMLWKPYISSYTTILYTLST